MTIDLLPTIAALAGARAPADRIIDGRDIWPLLANQRKAASPHDALYFYWGTELHAIRSGRWKLHLPHPYQSLETRGHERHAGQIREEASWSCRCSISRRIPAKRPMSPRVSRRSSAS